MALDRLRGFRTRDGGNRVTGSATAQLHQFRGELFVVDGWARGTGERLGSPGITELGTAVVRKLSHERATGRPLLTTPADERRQHSAWDKFCRRTAGVEPARYQPERRLLLLWDADGLRFSNGPPDPVEWSPLDSDNADAVGRELQRVLAEVAPRWPVVGSALVSIVGGRYLITPKSGVYLRDPIIDMPADGSVDVLGRLALKSLDRSETLADDNTGDYGASFRDALLWLGVPTHEFDAAPTLHLSRNDRGEVLVLHELTEVSLGDVDAIALGTAVATWGGPLVGSDAFATLFGPKTAWIAVADSAAEEVTNALELRDLVEVDTEDGIGRSADSGVLVVGPVDGWVLAVGMSLLLDSPNAAALSARLNAPVQYFASHRVVEGHQWTLAAEGAVVRSFRYLRETGEREETGAPTDAEHSIGVDADDFTPGEDDVFAIARAWSIDPTHVKVESLPIRGWWGERAPERR